MSKQTIGEFLATQRRMKGYTQQQVADMLGVSNRTLSSWEQNRTYPDILILPAIAEIYGISVDEIARGTRDGTSPAAVERKSESSNYIDARNVHAAHSLWIRGISLASPIFASLAAICVYYWVVWAIVLCATLAVLTAIATVSAVVYFNRSALDRTGAYIANRDRVGASDKCSLAISLNTCRTLLIAGWAYLLPVAVGALLLWFSYTSKIRITLLISLIAGVGALVSSVVYRNIAVTKYGDGRQNTLQRRNRVLFFICLTAILPVVASVICVSEIRIYNYSKVIYSGPREEFLRIVQTVHISEQMASLYGVEEGDVFLDMQEAHVGYESYRNEDGYYHITGNLYCGGVESGAAGTHIKIYYLAEDGNYKYVMEPECVWAPGEIINEHFDFEGNPMGSTATIGVDFVFLNDIKPNSFDLDKELVVGTPCYDSPPFFHVRPFRSAVYYNHFVAGDKDGTETLKYSLRCDYFPLVFPIACIVSAVSIATGLTVYYIMRKRIY